MYRRKHGFTLIEVMMVMGIIGLVIALGVPIYSAMTMSRSLGGGSDLIQGAFLKYRAKASASGKPIFLVFEHWHMDPTSVDEDEEDKLKPPMLQAFIVERNEEEESNWDVLEIDDPLKIPKGLWFNEPWIMNEVESYSTIPSTTPYADRINVICKDYYNLLSLPGRWAERLYMVVFMPNGHLEIIGRENIPGFFIEDEEDPDADIWLTNGDDTMIIDINPNTGRTKSERYKNTDYNKFIGE
ncbi:MAG: type II secretion system GspH family protein [Planctomycetes bacterium]|nr:type II secretion system GspH family protein [Planctomycetota bacterium]